MARQVLLLTYTPRSDVDLDAYHSWLREVDNPFFNGRPAVHRYVNYRVTGAVLGSERFTHFDLLEIEGSGGAGAVFGDPEIARFARDWVRLWGADPDPDSPDQSVNYHVLECEAVAWPVR
ncbi:hypothetical protein [Novosphingobium sp. Gsoil 351]|uniref:hypothetical protein n=1 Tax=Novosphingobium sp. Gsoil 351 TaxID=2675225 RepID=UPI0012B44437|nr:hypothetical protein [Novosphingobium sp. Gsoil 351]QGN53977.1 hypothetical protein GKE62_04905 [Novosphingobium sp. Gsoil 351]